MNAASSPGTAPTRRRFLAGLAGGAAGVVLAAPAAGLLAGCGGGDSAAATTTLPLDTDLALSRLVPDGTAGTEVESRLAFGLTDAGGPVLSGAPDELVFRLVRDGVVQPGEIRATRHDQGIPRPYYPLRTTFEVPGVYTAVAEVDGARLESAFTVRPAGDLLVPGPGDRLPLVATPTPEDAQGVDPICTRQPPCPLHTPSLGVAVESATPTVLLVGTPAHCRTGVCAPMLDLLLDEHARRGDRVRMLHAEVYTDATLQTLAPIVEALSLTYEPVVFVADAGGRITQRLDAVTDARELAAAIDTVDPAVAPPTTAPAIGGLSTSTSTSTPG